MRVLNLKRAQAKVGRFTNRALPQRGEEGDKMRIVERVPEHYDAQEVEFGRVYRWHPETVVVECKCGERSTFERSQIIDSSPDCECGEEHTSTLREELVIQLVDEDYEATHHPWHHWRTSEDTGIPY